MDRQNPYQSTSADVPAPSGKSNGFAASIAVIAVTIGVFLAAGFVSYFFLVDRAPEPPDVIREEFSKGLDELEEQQAKQHNE